MADKNPDESEIKEAVIDQLQQVIDSARETLKTIQCKEHGTALIKLDFLRSEGRFKIDCCCSKGEALVEEGIKNL